MYYVSDRYNVLVAFENPKSVVDNDRMFVIRLDGGCYISETYPVFHLETNNSAIMTQDVQIAIPVVVMIDGINYTIDVQNFQFIDPPIMMTQRLSGIILLDNGILYTFYNTSYDVDRKSTIIGGVEFLQLASHVAFCQINSYLVDKPHLYWCDTSGNLSIIDVSDFNFSRLPIAKFSFPTPIQNIKTSPDHQFIGIHTIDGNLYLMGQHIPEQLTQKIGVDMDTFLPSPILFSKNIKSFSLANGTVILLLAA